MNRDDEFIAQLEDYLDTFDGVVPLPASVREEVHARLPMTRQVRGSGGPERMLAMTSRFSASMRWVIGAAAVLAVVVVGVALLGNSQSGPGAGAAAPSSATSSATTPPSASPVPSASPSGQAGPTWLASAGSTSCGEGLADGCLPAGTYSLSPAAWPGTVTVDLPVGWFYWGAADDVEGVLVDSGKDALGGSGWGVAFMPVGSVSKDPCDMAAGQFDTAETATVEGLVTAMRSWPGFSVSPAEPIDVDGHAGQVVEVTATKPSSTCGDGTIWTTPGGNAVDAYPMVGTAATARPAQFRIVDIGGELLVIRTTGFPDPSPYELDQGVKPDPERHAADLIEMQDIIDSIRIGT